MSNHYLHNEAEEEAEPMAAPLRLPYENQLVGVFLYGLGVAAGQSKGEHPLTDAVSLLQQNPLDGPLADVLLSREDRAYLIEFKRLETNLADEDDKKARIRKTVSGDIIQKVWRGHLSAYPAKLQNRRLPLRFQPYFDLRDRRDSWDFATFAAGFLDKTLGADAESFKQYLQALLAATGSKGGSGVFVVQKPDGQIVFQVVANISDLNLQASVFVDLPPPSEPPPQQKIKHKGPSL